MTRGALVAAVVVGAGCAQILGLDSTKPPADASVDAPSVCDGLPHCGGSGRPVCGQLRTTGAAPGMPLRAATPTGAICAGSATSGPCALAVRGGTFDQLTSGSGVASGTIDDCGRFSVDLDPALDEIVVVFEGAGFTRSARVVGGRAGSGSGSGSASAGRDLVDALAVTTETQEAWSTQLAGSGSGAASPDTSTGFLVLYQSGGGPLASEQAARDGSSPFANPAGTVPWAAYFHGAFDSLDATATHTGSAGTALVVPGNGSAFSLEGFRTGKRCKQGGLRQLDGTLIFVALDDC